MHFTASGGEYLKTNNKKRLSKVTAKVLIYSLFACLCHATAVYFFTLLNPCNYPLSYLISTATYMLEHTLMSITVTLIGAFLLEITQKE